MRANHPARMNNKTKSRAAGDHPPATRGRLGLWLVSLTVWLPLLLILLQLSFNVRSLAPLAFILLFIIIYVGIPCGYVSLALGIASLVKKERPTKPAALSITLAIGPAIIGLGVIYNYLTIGEPL